MYPLRLICLFFLAGVTVGGCVVPEGRSRPAQRSPLGQERQVDLSRVFDAAGTVGTFVLLDDASGDLTRHNPQRAATRFPPASTFKIPNSLIALETGVADGPDFPLSYDPAAAPRQHWWPAAWTEDQTLQTALRDTVVWYYQEIARRIGRERMQLYVNRFDYGNRDISGPVDVFWLHGPLMISPDEQVRFLQRFHHGELGLSDRTTRTFKKMLVLVDTPEFRLSGKSGTLSVTPTRELAWHVGYVERAGRVWFYALNMEGDRVWEEWPPRRRVDLVLDICRRLGVLPSASGSSPASGG